MKGTVYGEFAVKFRAFGIDFGYVRRTVPFSDGLVLDLPLPLPRPLRIAFDRFGVRVDFWIAQVG